MTEAEKQNVINNMGQWFIGLFFGILFGLALPPFYDWIVSKVTKK